MKRKIAIAAVTAAVLVAGGTATAVAFADDDGRAAGRGAATARVSVGDAVSSAVRAVPGTVTEAELDDEDGALVWELDVYGSDKVWHDVTVDAGSGKVLGKHTSDDDRDRHAPLSAPVTLDAAVAAALKSAPGTVTSVELDGHRGKAVRWEVDVRGKDGTAHELDVDAKSAAVTADRSDDGRDSDDGDDD